MDRAQILKQAALFRDLSGDVIDSLSSRVIEKRLDRNEILFIAGETAGGLYVIADGSVRAFRAATDGREQIIHVEKAVTTIAEVPVFDGGPFPSTVAAEEPTTVYFIAREDIRTVSSAHPELALAAARLLAARLRKCAELVETLSLREVGQRVGMLFLQEAKVRGTNRDGGAMFSQRLTHNQLAARIGTVREVVTRSIHRLEEAGLIETSGKTIVIPDLAALSRYVGTHFGGDTN